MMDIFADPTTFAVAMGLGAGVVLFIYYLFRLFMRGR